MTGQGASTHEPALRGLRVLLAEDNPTNQLVATHMLRSLGAEVTLAVDGVDALDKLAEQVFDLGLIDIEMPRLSGLDVIREVRAGPAPRRRMALVALTAYVMRDHRALILEAGADGVIAKPILSVEEFGAEIRRCMGARVPVPEEAPEPGDDPAGIDVGVYAALGDAIGWDSMPEFLEKVEADIRASGDALEAGLAAGDRAAVRSASHVLISVAGAVGAVGLQKLAERLNAAAHQQGPGIGLDGPGIGGEEVGAALASTLGFVAACRSAGGAVPAGW